MLFQINFIQVRLDVITNYTNHSHSHAKLFSLSHKRTLLFLKVKTYLTIKFLAVTKFRADDSDWYTRRFPCLLFFNSIYIYALEYPAGDTGRTRQWNTFRERIHTSERILEERHCSNQLFPCDEKTNYKKVKCCESKKSFDTGTIHRPRSKVLDWHSAANMPWKGGERVNKSLENIACPATGNTLKVLYLSRSKGRYNIS